MKLLFNLKYHTTFGEELFLNVMAEKHSDATEQYRMNTNDGENWTCELSRTVTPDTHIDYYYSVNKDGKEIRHEWLVIPHRLETAAVNGTRYRVYDNWIDIPNDSSMYSSAITDCVAARKRQTSPHTEYAKTVRLKVRAPQLAAGQRLAIVGDAPCLGAWDTQQAVIMTEHKPHEWVTSIDAGSIVSGRLEFKFIAVMKSSPTEKDTSTAGATAPGTQQAAITTWETGMNRSIVLPEMTDGDVIVYELSQATFQIGVWRGAGTVIPVFSLRSEGSFGVGDFGDLKMFVDWADQTGQRVIQILPVNDTTITHTWQDSYPYNSISIYALHPQYTDLRQLPPLNDVSRRTHYEELRKELNALKQIDYERVNKAKTEYLRELYAQEGDNVRRSSGFKTFFEANRDWLVPYAAFCHYRDIYGTATFGNWPDHRSLSDKERKDMSDPQTTIYKEVAFWYYVQYNLDVQMRSTHEHARSHRVILKGDIPIGISRDGVEAWVEPRYFNLNGQAGAPPDAFSVNGQNWGFPTYNWDEMLRDGCSWWVRRFTKMAEYFDAYRIDHVLGFFRIWEIPIDSVHGLLGQFSPSLGMTREEIEAYGLGWQESLFTRPFITDWVLDRVFRENAEMVRNTFLDRRDDYFYDMKPEFDTQRKVEKFFKNEESNLKKDASYIRDGLYSLISNVLFLHDRKDPNKFHPRIGVQNDFVYEALYDCDKQAFNRLYNDYFYRRNNQFWYNEAMKKLPCLTEATRMLVCAEDLGMVPDCVPWVMNELHILSLEIQSMPKDDKVRFGYPERNPYSSVCTISTHDMSTLRQWWDEDVNRSQAYYNTMLRRDGTAPHPLPGMLARDIVTAHLNSPSMLCLLSLQDWLAIDEHIRLPEKDAERINIPANPRHYWRYRMHLTIEELMHADDFNRNIKEMIAESGR